MIKCIAALITGLCVAVSANATVADKKVQLKDVPAAVQAAVREHARDSFIRAVLQESVNGKVMYEVETTREGKTRDLLFDAAGALMEVEEEMSIDEAPVAVKSALSAHGKVVKLESITKGSVVTYEAQIEVHGKRAEIVLDGTGRPGNP